jgi:hypothetical protein
VPHLELIGPNDTSSRASGDHHSHHGVSQDFLHPPAGQSRFVMSYFCHYGCERVPRQYSAAYERTTTDSNNIPIQAQRSNSRNLSVFNAPTATFMWPGFQASSQMNTTPKIYVDYTRHAPSSCRRDPPGDARSYVEHSYVYPSYKHFHSHLHLFSIYFSVGLFPEEPAVFLPQKRRPSRDLPYANSAS